MKIQEITIQNFRSIKELTIEIRDNFLQLIGENNSGKTNIFKAIDYYFKKSVAGITRNDFFRKEFKYPIRISMVFNNLTGSDINLFRNFLIESKLTMIKVISINEETEKVSSDYFLKQEIIDLPYFDGKNIINWSTNKVKIKNWIRENDLQSFFQEDLDKITKSNVENGILDNLTEISNIYRKKKKVEVKKPLKWDDISARFPEILYIEATRKISEEIKTTERSKSIYKQILERIIIKSLRDDEIDKKTIEEFEKNLKHLKSCLNKEESGDKDKRFDIIKKLEKEIFSNLNQNIFTLGVEIRISTPQLHDFFRDSNIIINDGIPDPVENKGDGLKRSLIFSLFITYAKFLRERLNENEESDYTPFLFLIEEPELFLHPQAQKKLRDILNLISKYDQVFYSTHSPNFVDIEHYMSIGLVKKESIEKGTEISFIEEEIFQQDTRDEFNLLMRFNPERNEMFFAKKVAFVEGYVERIVLTRTAELLEKDFNKENISIIECNGKGNLPYFVLVLSCFEKPFIIIHDIDPLNSTESKPIEELKESGCSEKNLKQIKSRKRIFKLNKKIKDLTLNHTDKIGLIKINPNFEKLLGITERGERKAFKAFKVAKKLTKENLDEKLVRILDFILSFKFNNNRSELEEIEIEVSNSDEHGANKSITINNESKTSNDSPEANYKYKKKTQVPLNDFMSSE